MLIPDLVQRIQREMPDLLLSEQVPCCKLGTFSIGGPCELLIEPKSQRELCLLLRILTESGHGHRVIGFGSNSLFPDQGLRGVTLRLHRSMREVTVLDSGRFRVCGAAPLMTISRQFSKDGWSGLEFAGGIPASLGGALKMNAGAHGTEICEVVSRVEFVLSGGEVVDLEKSELEFSYRKSSIPLGAIVTSVEIELSKSNAEQCFQRMSECLEQRKAHQPLTVPSIGSIFQNPSYGDLTAGQILEELGAKGHKIGGAEISTKHANWIVNPKREAGASDVLALVSWCQKIALSERSIQLVPEMVVW